jgi:hypothetical protein
MAGIACFRASHCSAESEMPAGGPDTKKNRDRFSVRRFALHIVSHSFDGSLTFLSGQLLAIALVHLADVDENLASEGLHLDALEAAKVEFQALAVPGGRGAPPKRLPLGCGLLLAVGLLAFQ